MKYPENIRAIAGLNPDYLGFIFYPSSKRYCEPELEQEYIKTLDSAIRTIGVFVNASFREIMDKVNHYALDGVQLHGEEDPELCEKLRLQGLLVIKVFSIAETFDFTYTEKYTDVCDYFLFDTKTPEFGGSGKTFSWEILSHYKGPIPFFLSGGLGEDHIHALKNFKHPMFYAVDINSRFETAPGQKDDEKVKGFINNIRHEIHG